MLASEEQKDEVRKRLAIQEKLELDNFDIKIVVPEEGSLSEEENGAVSDSGSDNDHKVNIAAEILDQSVNANAAEYTISEQNIQESPDAASKFKGNRSLSKVKTGLKQFSKMLQSRKYEIPFDNDISMELIPEQECVIGKLPIQELIGSLLHATVTRKDMLCHAGQIA
ncbi:hypothetical protein HDU98_007317 [Podochytrium sp. JEL0797]|nr:hypothetical protein HDU98_007317 [Podochytrium sp. JEL0797]